MRLKTQDRLGMSINLKDLQLAKIKAVEGCECPSSVRWFNCRCPGATVTEYDALVFNYLDVLEGGCSPDPGPTVEAVAEVIRLHPGATLVYFGGNQPIYGGGAMGETHYQLAKKMADST